MDDKSKYIVILGFWLSILTGLNVVAAEYAHADRLWLFVSGFAPAAAVFGQKWYSWLVHQVTGEKTKIDFNAAEFLANRHLDRGIEENA